MKVNKVIYTPEELQERKRQKAREYCKKNYLKHKAERKEKAAEWYAKNVIPKKVYKYETKYSNLGVHNESTPISV